MKRQSPTVTPSIPAIAAGMPFAFIR